VSEHFIVEEPVEDTSKSDLVIKKYKEGIDMQYPLILMECGSNLELFRVEVLKGMLKKSTFLGIGDSYNMYLQIMDSKVWVGLLDKSLLKSFLVNPLFSIFSKRILLSEDRVVEGDLMFALCVAREK